jgi:hypothetical protein
MRPLLLLAAFAFGTVEAAADDPGPNRASRPSSLAAIQALAQHERDVSAERTPARSSALAAVKALADESRETDEVAPGPARGERDAAAARQDLSRARQARRRAAAERLAAQQNAALLAAQQNAALRQFGFFDVEPVVAPGAVGFGLQRRSFFGGAGFFPFGFGFGEPIVFGISGPVTTRFEHPLTDHWKLMDNAIRRAAEQPPGLPRP